MIQDVSDLEALRRSARARRQSEARKSAILENALSGIVSIDHEGRITEFNAMAETMFGYRREDTVGRPMAELLIPTKKILTLPCPHCLDIVAPPFRTRSELESHAPSHDIPSLNR